ncbi:MAG TPA: hypothetical protein PKD90_17980, partial [Phnomibacter sp.]|nr:hypothetical protein [Phnomibacter sp.]
ALHPVRRQYLADSLLTWLKALVQEGMGLMAVTGVDITTTGGNPAGYGTLGLGFRPGCISVVSDYRLNAAHRPDSIRHHMLLKIALHELGHNAGLPHCNTPTCYMQEVEKRGNWEALHSFCSLCQNKIRVP